MPNPSGLLYIVATPIGNLADISARAREVLATVDVILCEDTRHSRRLLDHLGVTTPLRSHHEHNETQSCESLVQQLRGGQSLALISDAGTPLISDPGFPLVRAARAQGITVVPIPGPSALICALSAAGLASDRFLFLGFAPRTAAKRQSLLESVSQEPGTLIFYESGRRILAMLDDCAATLGATRRAVVARELTKRFETFLDGTLAALATQLAAEPEQCLGELVVLIAGADKVDDALSAEQQRVLEILLAEQLPVRQVADLAARISGGARNVLYRAALAARNRED